MKKAEFNSMEETLVEVTGMGAMINYPTVLLQAALELAGFEVEVINHHNEPGKFGHVDKEELKMRILAGEKVTGKQKIKLVAEHLPWPG